MNTRLRHLVLLLFSALYLVACGGGGGGGSSSTPVSSSDASLSSLVLSSGVLAPVFDAATVGYAVNVDNTITSISVTPTTANSNASVSVDGVVVNSGQASAAIALSVGANTITVLVTAEDGVNQRTYTLNVTRASPPSSDANLSALSVSVGALAPAFSNAILAYSVSVANGVSSTTVTATIADANAAQTIDGVATASGAASQAIALNEGDNQIVVQVTAEDGAIQLNYTITINRATAGLSTLELVDPTPHVGDQFGAEVVELDNGNIVVSDPLDDNVAMDAGAVHLYNSSTGALVASIYGDSADDRLGSNGVVALSNGNYVISSPSDDVLGIANAGSVRLIDGTTGQQIGSALSGDIADDFMGDPGVTALSNGHYVVASSRDNEAGIMDAGSVRLLNGTSAVQIGAGIAGDVVADSLSFNNGNPSVTALPNNNFVVVSVLDNEGGIDDAGSIRLLNGSTGNEINAIVGDVVTDAMGRGDVAILPNGNFIVTSENDDEGGVADAGSARLISAVTGLQIGNSIVGMSSADKIGAIDGLGKGQAVLPLDNNNFAVATEDYDSAGVSNAGAVMLVNGTTATIVNTLNGDENNDRLGEHGLTALSNGNFVIASPGDDENGIANAGSVRLVDADTGGQVGTALVGDAVNDMLGGGGITALGNGNYVVVSGNDTEAGIVAAGSVRLINGDTGAQIVSIAGDTADARLGISGVVALDNNNFVMASEHDDAGGVVNAGSVRLINGQTGNQIGASLNGDNLSDQLGSGGVHALAGNRYVVLSALDDEGGITNAGSARVLDGTTGAELGSPIFGALADDFEDAAVTQAANGTFFILQLSEADNNGLADSGQVLLVRP